MSTKSAILLSIGSILLLGAIACTVVGFATDFWLKYDVHYNNIFKDLGRTPPIPGSGDSANRTKLLVDRTRGLFSWCYPDQKPYEVGLFRKYVDGLCEKISYQIIDSMSEDQKRRIYLMRTQVAFFIICFIFFLLAIIVGIVGCWKRNSMQILATGLLVLFAAFFAAAATGMFHGIEFIERHLLKDVPERVSSLNVPDVVRNNTKVRYWWSYMLCWIGVGLAILAALTFFIASCLLHRQKVRNNRRYMHTYNSNKMAVISSGHGSVGAGTNKDGSRYLVPVYYDNTVPGNVPRRADQLPGGTGTVGTVYYDNGYYRSSVGTNGTGNYYASGNPMGPGNTNTAGYGYGYYK